MAGVCLDAYPDKVIPEKGTEKSSVAKATYNRVRQEHEQVAYEEIPSVALRILRAPHYRHTACVEEVASTQDACKWCEVGIEEDNRSYAMEVFPVSLLILLSGSEPILCRSNAVYADADHEQHYHNYEDRAHASHPDEDTHVLLAADCDYYEV